ncbi:hypothetical protein H7X46_28955, partial [Pseudonocardia sp. C8]|nr:hypothetical protein [Pseudonocardia sp. C8]
MTTLAWLIAAVALGLGLLAGAALARRPSPGRPAPGAGPTDRPVDHGPTLADLLH